MRVTYLPTICTRSGEVIKIRDLEIGEEVYVDFIGMKHSDTNYYFSRDDEYFYRRLEGGKPIVTSVVSHVMRDPAYLSVKGIIQ